MTDKSLFPSTGLRLTYAKTNWKCCRDFPFQVTHLRNRVRSSEKFNNFNSSKSLFRAMTHFVRMKIGISSLLTHILVEITQGLIIKLNLLQNFETSGKDTPPPSTLRGLRLTESHISPIYAFFMVFLFIQLYHSFCLSLLSLSLC